MSGYGKARAAGGAILIATLVLLVPAAASATIRDDLVYPICRLPQGVQQGALRIVPRSHPLRAAHVACVHHEFNRILTETFTRTHRALQGHRGALSRLAWYPRSIRHATAQQCHAVHLRGQYLAGLQRTLSRLQHRVTLQLDVFRRAHLRAAIDIIGRGGGPVPELHAWTRRIEDAAYTLWGAIDELSTHILRTMQACSNPARRRGGQQKAACTWKIIPGYGRERMACDCNGRRARDNALCGPYPGTRQVKCRPVCLKMFCGFDMVCRKFGNTCKGEKEVGICWNTGKSYLQ